MTTFNHPLGARARRRNFLLLGAVLSVVSVRVVRWARELPGLSFPGRRGASPAWRRLAGRRATEAAYWVDSSLHAWPRGGRLRRPDPV